MEGENRGLGLFAFMGFTQRVDNFVWHNTWYDAVSKLSIQTYDLRSKLTIDQRGWLRGETEVGLRPTGFGSKGEAAQQKETTNRRKEKEK
jgi:hypothetical protein